MKTQTSASGCYETAAQAQRELSKTILENLLHWSKGRSAAKKAPSEFLGRVQCRNFSFCENATSNNECPLNVYQTQTPYFCIL